MCDTCMKCNISDVHLTEPHELLRRASTNANSAAYLSRTTYRALRTQKPCTEISFFEKAFQHAAATIMAFHLDGSDTGGRSP